VDENVGKGHLPRGMNSIKNKKGRPSAVAHACTPAIQEVEIRKIVVLDQPGEKLVRPHLNQ
jgi:hypothetical protein